VARLLTWLFKIFRIHITIDDSKYLQINQPYILICNHQSSLDLLTLMSIWPGGNCTILAKRELLYAGPFGIASWLCGVTFIDRLNPNNARNTIDDLADRINKEKLRVWMYPEGTRNSKTELLPFKKGAFHLAIRAQVPIVCIVTSSYSNFYNKKEKKFLPNGQVKLRVLPPFQTRGMNFESVNQVTKHLQEKMQKEFELLNKEMDLDKCYYTPNKILNNDDNSDEEMDSKLNAKLNYSTSFCDESSILQKSMSFSDDNNNSIEVESEETKKSL